MRSGSEDDRSHTASPIPPPAESLEIAPHGMEAMKRRRGRAPPLDAFTGEDPEVRLEDWIPGLKRVADCNAWSETELLLQLAGHLQGWALQEWNLLEDRGKSGWDNVVQALSDQLDLGSRVLAAQIFRHLSQGANESVADFVCHLEAPSTSPMRGTACPWRPGRSSSRVNCRKTFVTT